MGLLRAVLICATLGLIFGKAHGSGSSTDVLIKTPGETVVFNTTRDPATPYTYLTWERLSGYTFTIVTANGSVITVHPVYRDRVTLFDDGSLELRNLESSDSHKYRVNITSTEGSDVSIVYQLFVQEPVSDVKFSPSTTELIESTLHSVKLTCSASGTDVKFSFYNSTHIFPSYSDYLVMYDLTRHHTGPWGCEAYNRINRVKCQEEFNFTFSYGPDEATVEAVPSLEVYSQGSNVTLRCTVVGSEPEAEISWAHDSHSDIKGPELVLAPLTYDDRGTYECRAYNRKTEDYATDSVYISVEYVLPEGPLSEGALVGIAIACVLVASGIVLVVVLMMNRKRLRRRRENTELM